MNMSDWAKNEIDIACKKENPNWDGESFDYGCMVYWSALKAFNTLMEDDHSGFSFSLTKQILNRLMNGQPLTPIIEDDFFIESDMIIEHPDDLRKRGLKSSLQCPRMSSLFRTEDLDGNIIYSDVDRYYCQEIDDTNDTYSGGGALKILDELFPITMPYYPKSGKYKIVCDTFLCDKNYGDFDTKAWLYIITPEGEKVDINKYTKELIIGYDNETICNSDGQMEMKFYPKTVWIDITKEEFYERKKHKIND